MIKKPIILICTHKPYNIIQNDIMKSILVGAYKHSDNFTFFRDDVGENISNKNDTYCELTALYWAWKNLDESYDYVGLFHYRRYLTFNDKAIYKRFFPNLHKISSLIHKYNHNHILKLCNSFDIIMIEKERLKAPSYRQSHSDEFMTKMFFYNAEVANLVLDILDKQYPNSSEELRKILYNQEYSSYLHLKNMFFMKRKYFNQYMEFLFNILFELEQRLSTEQYKHINISRRFGYISEILINVFLKTQITEEILIKEFNLTKAFNLELNSTFLNKAKAKIKARLNIAYFKYLFNKLTQR
jgi:hypothetical protein